MLERELRGKTTVLRAERFPDIDPRFIGVTVEENKAFLIRGREGREGSPTVLADTTMRGGVTGHLDVYQSLIPPEMGIVYLPTTETISKMTTLIRQGVNHFPLLMLQGGEDPDPSQSPLLRVNGDLTERYGGVNRVRDRENMAMVEAATARGHELFVLVICRGMELWCISEIVQASPYHYPEERKTEMVTHPVSRVDINHPIMSPLNLKKIRKFPGNHHLQVRDLPIERKKEGWNVYLRDDLEGKVEGGVRLDRDGLVTGMMFQGHPERFPGTEGLIFRQWIHLCIRAHWQRYHN